MITDVYKVSSIPLKVAKYEIKIKEGEGEYKNILICFRNTNFRSFNLLTIKFVFHLEVFMIHVKYIMKHALNQSKYSLCRTLEQKIEG